MPWCDYSNLEAEITDRDLQFEFIAYQCPHVLYWRDKNLIFSWRGMSNLQCQKDLPDHNRLSYVTIDDASGARTLLRVTMY